MKFSRYIATVFFLVSGLGFVSSSCSVNPKNESEAARGGSSDKGQNEAVDTEPFNGRSSEKAVKSKTSSTAESSDGSPSCENDDAYQKFSFFLDDKLELIVCAKVHEKLSDTVYEVSKVKIYSKNVQLNQSKLLTETDAKGRRELLFNSDHQKVLLFEDLPAEKKLPLFSQEITCAGDECFSKRKVCLFKQNPEIYTEALANAENVEAKINELLKTPDGQVKVLLAALSGFKPAVEIYSREPQALEGEARESFIIRKKQFEQARLLCKGQL